MIVDAYRALGLLSSHPRIDPERIAAAHEASRQAVRELLGTALLGE